VRELASDFQTSVRGRGRLCGPAFSPHLPTNACLGRRTLRALRVLAEVRDWRAYRVSQRPRRSLQRNEPGAEGSDTDVATPHRGRSRRRGGMAPGLGQSAVFPDRSSGSAVETPDDRHARTYLVVRAEEGRLVTGPRGRPPGLASHWPGPEACPTRGTI